MASIPLAAAALESQTADPQFRSLGSSPSTGSADASYAGDRFRDLLRSDSSRGASTHDERDSSPPAAGSADSNDAAAQPGATPAESSPAASDRDRGDTADERRGESPSNARDEADSAVDGSEQAVDAPPSASSSESHSTVAGHETTAEEASDAAQTLDNDAQGLPHESGQKVSKHAKHGGDAQEPLPEAKQHGDNAKNQSKPSAAEQAKPPSKLTTAAKPIGEHAAGTDDGAAASVVAESVADAAQTGETVAPDSVSTPGKTSTAATAANPGVETVAAENGGVVTSQHHATVAGPGKSVEAPTTDGHSDSLAPVRAKVSAEAGATRPGAMAGDARNGLPNATGAGAPAAPSTGTTTAASSVPAVPTVQAASAASAPTAETAVTAPHDLGSSPAPANSDLSATSEGGEAHTGNASERSTGTTRSTTTRNEGVPQDHSLSVADRVRMVQRVAVALESAHARGGVIRMRLEPPELGSIRVELNADSGSISARLEAESSQVQRLLLDSLPQLRERLAEQQIKIEHFQVDVMNQHDRQFAQARHDQHEHHDRGSREQRHAQPGRGETATSERQPQREAATLRQQLPWELDRLNVLV